MYLALKIILLSFIYIVEYVVYIDIYIQRERDKYYMFNSSQVTIVCMFVFSNEQADQNKLMTKCMNLFYSNNLSVW